MIYISLPISVIIILFPLLITGKATWVIVISFYLVAPPIIFMLWKLIYSKIAGISFATTFLFFLLFFYIAPILQLEGNTDFLINTLPVQERQIFFVNGMISIFLFFYAIFYFRRSNDNVVNHVGIREDRLKIILPILGVFSFAVSIWALSEINLLQLIITEPDDDQDLITALIKHKVIFLIPFLTLAIYLRINLGGRNFTIIIILLVMVFLTKNPFFDRRNSLGPIYLTLVCIAFPYITSNAKNFFIFLFTILVIAFPASSIFTHHDPSNWGDILTSNLLFEEISGHFVNMHYDAWANFVGTVDYVEKTGYKVGVQALGSLLFYVPRAVWLGKPISSGQTLGEYLSQYYQLWFQNISCPFPAEGYIDFGPLGVIIFAIALAWYTRRLDMLVTSNNTITKISAIYFSLFLLFVLRGSLLPAVAYGVGAYLAIIVVPRVLSYFMPGRRNAITKNI
jgi:hypothetical protein